MELWLKMRSNTVPSGKSIQRHLEVLGRNVKPLISLCSLALLIQQRQQRRVGGGLHGIKCQSKKKRCLKQHTCPASSNPKTSRVGLELVQLSEDVLSVK